MQMRALASAVALLAASSPLLAIPLILPITQASAEELDLETLGRDLVRDLADGKYDEASAHFSPTMKKEVGRERLASVFDPLREKRGVAKSIRARRRHDEPDGLVTFTYKCNWKSGKASDVRLTVKPDGTVVGLLVRDEDSAEDEEAREKYETKARLRPPFHGTFVAHNAARDASNPHYPVRSQRFAVDWVMADDKGKTYRGEGRKNEDYLCWGKEALSPADGTVAVVVDGVPENPAPGQRDGYFIPGNHVAIALDGLGGGEVAMLMHLVPGSIAVKVGDKVKAGQVLGKIGNSGNSTEPHLHFQLCDKERLTDCASLPAVFRDVTLDGKKAQRALPTEGSRLSE